MNSKILKSKEKNEIPIQHKHSLKTENLELGLSYLLKHNKGHVKDIEKWINKMKQAGKYNVAEELLKVLYLSKKINEYFKYALKILKH